MEEKKWRQGIGIDIDHYSHVKSRLEEQCTVHEGVAARVSEKRDIIAEQCKLNRQIDEDNALLWELRGYGK